MPPVKKNKPTEETTTPTTAGTELEVPETAATETKKATPKTKATTKPKTEAAESVQDFSANEPPAYEIAYNQVMNVPVTDLFVEDGFNARIDYGEHDGTFFELCDSIKENGIYQPITVFLETDTTKPLFNKLVLIDGHRRLKAVSFLNKRRAENADAGANIESVEIIIREEKTTWTDRFFEMMITGGHSKPLTKMELGDAWNRLINIEKTFTVMTLSKKIGKSHTYISDAIKLATAPEDVKSKVIEGKITPTAVITMIREESLKGASDDDLVKKMEAMIKKAEEKGKETATNQEIDDDEEEAEAPEPVEKGLKANQFAQVLMGLTELWLDSPAMENESDTSLMTIFGQIVETLASDFDTAKTDGRTSAEVVKESIEWFNSQPYYMSFVHDSKLYEKLQAEEKAKAAKKK